MWEAIKAFVGSLDKGDMAGWAQAIGTIFAIFASGWIASCQAKSQYQNSLKLQGIQDKNQQTLLTGVVVEIIKNSSERVKYVYDMIKSPSDLSAIANKTLYYDFDGLTDVLESLKQIPLKDLPSAHLVTSIMVLISGIRQLQIQVDKAISEHRSMTASQFNIFFQALQQIKDSTAKTHSEAKQQLEALKND